MAKYYKHPHQLFNPRKLPRVSAVKQSYQEASRTNYENSFIIALEANDTIEIDPEYILIRRFMSLISLDKHNQKMERIINGCTHLGIPMEVFNPHIYGKYLDQYAIDKCPDLKHIKVIARKHGYLPITDNNGQIELPLNTH